MIIRAIRHFIYIVQSCPSFHAFNTFSDGLIKELRFFLLYSMMAETELSSILTFLLCDKP